MREATEVDAAVAAVLARHGRLDVLVNNAGYCRVRPLLDLAVDEVTDMWRVHALGTLLCSQAAARPMIEAGFGRIVNVTSGPGGYGASATTSHYQAAKSAQTSFGRSLALALGPHGVTVNSSLPRHRRHAALGADGRRPAGGRGPQRPRGAGRPRHRRVELPAGPPADGEEVARWCCSWRCQPSGAITGEVLAL